MQSFMTTFIDAMNEAIGKTTGTIMLDFLADPAKGMSLAQTESDQVVRAYINGRNICRFTASLLARGKESKKLDLIGLLAIATEYVAGLDGESVGDYEIRSVTVSTPGIRTRTQDGVCTYGLSLNIEYQEKKQ